MFSEYPCSKWVVEFPPTSMMLKRQGVCLVEAYHVIRLLVDKVTCKDQNPNPRLRIHLQNA